MTEMLTTDAPAETIAAAFSRAMGCSATPVTIVTTDGPAGRFGQTVSAMTKVSEAPPIAMICLHRRSPAVDAILRNGTFCVNVLADDQDAVADSFAGRPRAGAGRWDFDCAEWASSPQGGPRLVGALSALHCTVHRVTEIGSHRVFFGEVVDVARAQADPLVYLRRGYHRVAELDTAIGDPRSRPTSH
ncbi:conserved protein of DIM6/NTAB family [Actinoalloteichus sp. GBA129-24]|nr:conserved protein of DIM6/NTAB family [Actinoalloteichus sp. GBA129-24]